MAYLWMPLLIFVFWQVLSTRARKNVMISDIKVEVCIFAFDILYLNGQTLLQEQLNVRKEVSYPNFTFTCWSLNLFVSVFLFNEKYKKNGRHILFLRVYMRLNYCRKER